MNDLIEKRLQEWKAEAEESESLTRFDAYMFMQGYIRALLDAKIIDELEHEKANQKIEWELM